jgi:periplasmic protein TonB
MSRRYGEQGTVTLRVMVRADGRAGQVEVRRSSGFPMLDDAAREAVQDWRFNPATRDGKPVPEWYLVPVTFTLRN